MTSIPASAILFRMERDLRIFDIRVKVNAAEKARLERWASRDHLHVSTAMRRAGLIAAAASDPESVEPDDLEAAKEA